MIYRKAGLLKSPLYLFGETTPKSDMFVGQNSGDRRPVLPPSVGINNLVKWSPPQGSCIPKDESTVGVDSRHIGYLSISRMWHIVFATSLSSRCEAKPKGIYPEWRYVLSSRQVFVLVGRI